MLLQLIKAIRPINLLVITLTFYVLYTLDINSREFIPDSFQISLISLKILTISTLLIAAAGYLINDYYDKEIDFINKAHKQNSLSKKALLKGSIILNIIALTLSFTFALTHLIFWVFPCSIFLLWLYSFRLKGLPFIGNLSVALLSATVPFIYLSIQDLAHAHTSSVDLIIIFSFLAFFSTLARELVKDIEDIEGDKTQELKTIPILWGIKTAKFWTIFFLLCTLFILGLLIAGSNYFNFTILSLLIATIFGFLPLLLSVAKSYQATEKKHYKQAGNHIKISMFGFLLFIYIHAITL